jgi:hypothetical protein
MDRRAVLAAGLALAAGPAFAIDPGTASGRYAGDEGRFSFSHATALILDNAEGFRDTPNEMRVVLADREVLPADLTGLAFPPVWRMAREGKLKGLLLAFDPADRNALQVTVLAQPEPGYSLANISLSNTAGVWQRLEVSATRVAGALKPDLRDGLEASFSAPVFTDKVTADLKGPAAAASEPVKAILAHAEAVSRGDYAAARGLATPALAAQFDDIPPQMQKLMKAELPKLLRQLKAPPRVVIREQTAAVMLEKGTWTHARRVDGVWKAD